MKCFNCEYTSDNSMDFWNNNCQCFNKCGNNHLLCFVCRSQMYKRDFVCAPCLQTEVGLRMQDFIYERIAIWGCYQKHLPISMKQIKFFTRRWKTFETFEAAKERYKKQNGLMSRRCIFNYSLN